MELIKSITASSDSDITFADGSNGVTFDSTFKTYCFKFIDIHGSVNFRHLGFDIQVSGGSGFDEPKISSGYEANHSQTNNGTQFQVSIIDLIDSTIFFGYMELEVKMMRQVQVNYYISYIKICTLFHKQ